MNATLRRAEEKIEDLKQEIIKLKTYIDELRRDPPNYGWQEDMDDGDNIAALLGLCGCGRPDDVLRLFLRSLNRMDSNRPERPTYQEELKENFPSFQSPLNEDLVWAHIYQLDHLGLTEHGSSAWCGWLTDKGVFVRDKLATYLEARDGK